MTQNRKDELYDQMIAWICEHYESDEELFYLLTEQFGMTREELHDHSIESLDRFFADSEAIETKDAGGISLTDFIAGVSEMINSEEKTAVLDWIEFAGFRVDVDKSGERTLEGELRKMYLPLCYVRNNFSDSVLQKSLHMDTIGNEIICGAMLFAAGYEENEVRDMGNEGLMEDGYIPFSDDEHGTLYVVAIADRDECIFVGNNMGCEIIAMNLERAIQLSQSQSRDIVSVLNHPATAGMPLQKITDARLIHAVKVACTDSTAFAHITVYNPETGEIRVAATEGLTPEQREALFCCGSFDQVEGVTDLQTACTDCAPALSM